MQKLVKQSIMKKTPKVIIILTYRVNDQILMLRYSSFQFLFLDLNGFAQMN